MSENEIITGCIQGCERAQRELYKQYKPYLLAICRKYVTTNYEAEDIIQEVLISVFRSIKGFRHDSELRSWLYRITVNKAINYYTTEKSRSHMYISHENNLLQEENGESFEEAFIAIDRLEKAMKLLQNQAPAQYTNFRLYEIEGLSHREIAEDLDISEGTSKSNYSRALKRLRQNLILIEN
jgi:RNA polymerase sigma-70 factor (ECF subfamily)